MLDRFAANVNKIWDAGASACVEITPSEQFTIARDVRTKGIDILSSQACYCGRALGDVFANSESPQSTK